MDKETTKQAKRVVTCITFMLKVVFSSRDNASMLVSTASTCIRAPNRHGLLLSTYLEYMTRHSTLHKFQHSITSVLETERGSTSSHSVENSLWRRLWTCRKTDYRTKEFNNVSSLNFHSKRVSQEYLEKMRLHLILQPTELLI
jgi:hypothetical protein